QNPCVTTRHLQDDLMKAGTSASVATIRRALNKQGLHGHTPLLTTRNIKSRQFYGLIKPNWNCLNIWTSGLACERPGL
uniref:Transposase Tc1-like domain-containing protein n=1 Tax=Dicentrarchus labrax TaxID=13489 RepID=A0A8P4FX48_DICLA